MKTCPRCKEDKPLDAFAAHKRRKDGLQVYCRLCKKIMDATHYQVHKEKQFARNKKNSLKNREFVRRLKSKSGCVACRERNPWCLDFHHPDSNKEGEVSVLLGTSITKALEEAKKCLILCANCHRKLHGDQLCLILPKC